MGIGELVLRVREPECGAAERCGAAVVVDPAVESPWGGACDGRGFTATMPDEYNAEIDAVEGLARVPVLWDGLARPGRDRYDLSCPSGGLVTGRVGLEGVAGAFTTLVDPDHHARVLVDPSLGTDRIPGAVNHR
ncbi:hypothetical protein [Streptomyces sp. NBC_01012]|uniref:hypothetical protein n=1 Tax=Streptomyces sp. NBC_01012 TaxID=2903717 RepID=UPI00386DDB0D|nr:hypothetical protein OG623_02005 [Streptomyces sp. NBC_01012]